MAPLALVVSAVLACTLLAGAGTAEAKAAKQPAKVSKPAVSAVTSSALEVTWKKAGSAKGYQVKVYKGAKAVKTCKVKSRSAKVTGLSASTTYRVKVRAYGKSGKKVRWGKWSTAATATTKARTWSVSYHANGGTVAGGRTSYTSADSFDLPTPTRAGCVFEGWYASASLSGRAVTGVARGSSGDLSLYAKWSLDYGAIDVDTSARTYDGTQVTPAVTSGVLSEGSDYEVSYGDNVNAGRGTVTVRGLGAVTGKKTYTFAINQRVAELEWGSTDLTYDGTKQAPTCTVANAVEGDEVSVVIAGLGIHVNSYEAEIESVTNPNYTLPSNNTICCDYAITPCVADLKWDCTELIYNGTKQSPTCSVENAAKGDKLNVTYDDGGATNVGSYKVKVTGLGNADYVLPSDGSVECAYAIAKAPVAVCGVTVKDKTYDGTATAEVGSYELEGLQNGEKLTLNATAEFADKNAGAEKSVSITGWDLEGATSANYEIATEKLTNLTATINKKVLNATWSEKATETDTWTDSSTGTTYDCVFPPLDIVDFDIVAGDDVSVVYKLVNQQVDQSGMLTYNVEASLTGSSAENYQFDSGSTKLSDLVY